MTEGRDPYQVLGLSKTASADDIRRAYRKLARATHPDIKPGDKAAEEKFKEISQAHDILGDPKRRALYDEFGSMGLREGFNPEQARAFGRQTAGFGGGGAGFGGGSEGFDLGDLFGDFFGGRTSSAGPARGSDVSASVDIDLAAALTGTEVSLELPTEGMCSACQSSGRNTGAAPQRCDMCRGTGQITPPGLPGTMRMRCNACGGRGNMQPDCLECGGRGVRSRRERVTVRIPAGADHQSKLRVPGRGASARGGRGDLILETRIRPHRWFRREGLNLVVRLPLTVAEAVMGAQVSVPTPSGEVTLRVPQGAQTGLRLRLRGRGVRKGPQQGDLFAEVEIHVPDVSGEDVEHAARALDAFYKEPPREELKL